MKNKQTKHERLQKVIANYGVCSRRKAEELILCGKVFVNGEKTTKLATKISENDIIEVNGKKINKPNKKIYILLNKPTGIATTTNDEKGRPTVIDLIKGEIEERLFPVGRLDIATSGALILTNDGDFAYKLTHPKYEIPKTYEVILNKEVTEQEIRILEKGVVIDGKKTAKCEIKMPPPLPPSRNKQQRHPMKQSSDFKLHITIHEGRNRQVRKMFEVIERKVIELKRVKIGNIELGNLPLGRFRHLSPQEIKNMK